MTTIGFLHTADVHVPTFRGLREELAPGWQDLHVVDPSLLADARREGITPALAARIDAQLHELADRGADVIVCTCSTLGGHVERRTPDLGVPVLRLDRPMAEAAVAAGARIAVVATVASTLPPTTELLRSAAAGPSAAGTSTAGAASGEAASGRAITLVEVLCAEAWPLFEAGDLDGYARAVAARAREIAPGVDAIVLAQASLTPVAALLADLPIPVLSSPRAAVARAISTMA